MTAGLPLAGTRIVDLTTFLSGPFATQILADLGAEIIKVEPPSGDSTRPMPPHFVGDDSAYFLTINRGKRSIVIDLKQRAGIRVLRDLILKSDAVIENFRPGVVDRLGLHLDELQAAKPDLVWVSISGFGQSGPWRDRPAYDMIVQALSGVMSLTGEPGGTPVRMGAPIGDLAAGFYGTIALLSSLIQRTRDGSGRVVDVSMLDAQLVMLSYQATYAMLAGVDPQPQGRGHDSIPTYRSFTGGDGRMFVITANTERMWQGLCETIGRPELIDDPRFSNGAQRLTNKVSLWQIVEAEFARRPAHEWVEALIVQGVPAALIKTVLEATADAEEHGRGMIYELDDEAGRAVKVVGNPILLDGQQTPVPRYPPQLGQDTDAVLADVLGLGADEVGKLRADGIVS